MILVYRLIATTISMCIYEQVMTSSFLPWRKLAGECRYSTTQGSLVLIWQTRSHRSFPVGRLLLLFTTHDKHHITFANSLNTLPFLKLSRTNHISL